MILVAGGSGRLGRVLVERLTRGGATVRTLSRAPAISPPAGAETIVGDVRNAVDVERATHGVDTVISAMSAFGLKGASLQEVDLEGNAHLIAAAKKHGVTRFVLVSVRGAAPDHPALLHRVKFSAEQMLAGSGIPFTVVRPSPFTETFLDVVCGPLQNGGAARVFGKGVNPINFVSVLDVASCVERACCDPRLDGRSIDIGGPENISLLGLVDAFRAVTSAPGGVKHIPLPALRAMALLMRPFNPTLARLAEASVRMDTTDMTFDATAFRHQFPELALTSVADAARRQYGGFPRAAS